MTRRATWPRLGSGALLAASVALAPLTSFSKAEVERDSPSAAATAGRRSDDRAADDDARSAPSESARSAPSDAARSSTPDGAHESPNDSAAPPSATDEAPEPTVPDVNLRRIVWRRGTAFARTAARGELAELTLEPRLQRAAERLLAAASPVSGGAVLIDARTGHVLVWAERRATGGAPGQVLLDGLAPAASVFKLVTSAALLELGGVHPHTRVCHAGGRRSIEPRHLEPPREGSVICAPFGDALGHSRNAVFAQLTTRHLARQDLLDMAERLGFGAPVPFDAAVPMGRLEVPYSDLEVARTAAGFQGNRLSVLGGAHLAMTIASGGRPARLHIVRAHGDYAAPAERELLPSVLKPRTAQRLTRMMEVTVHSGTCREAFSMENGRSYLGSVRVAGKTGTLHPSDSENFTSWFVGFAPSRAPEVVVSVMIQNGKLWRRKANQIARDLLRAYFHAQGRPLVTDPFAPDPSASR